MSSLYANVCKRKTLLALVLNVTIAPKQISTIVLTSIIVSR